MTQFLCPRCDEWWGPGEHDPRHLEERQVEALEHIADQVGRATSALTSAFDKVMVSNPTWNELPNLLTQDELRLFLTFIVAAPLSKKTVG